VIGEELERFERTLAQGLRLAGMEPSRQHRAPRGSAGSEATTPTEREVPSGGTRSGVPEDGRAVLDGAVAFDLLQTYGFPFELTRELAEAAGKRVDEDGFRAALEAHRARSRPAGGAKFRGGLADHSAAIVQYHTATHLLQAALRAVLGEHVIQRGSNITHERLRFDFSHHDRLAPEELTRVEQLVNGWLDRDLVVVRAEMSGPQARALGAIGAFGEKYGETVSVYSIADRTTGEVVSREFCGGPHVGALGELGARRLRVVREQAVASGIRRIKAVLR
jgi:alanyl-tRNA synthetase